MNSEYKFCYCIITKTLHIAFLYMRQNYRHSDGGTMDRQADDPITRCPLPTFQDWCIKESWTGHNVKRWKEKKGNSPPLSFVCGG